ncbi:type II toxin-antitoxin system HipA family toxin [Gilvimarinus sp. SDUM040013]|uniref:Type II toxin-antitoxin system HipA family toxin n=1 Tax=Gilvimarinus gilvus TaxID=3058038 RepID=A0ABU4S0I0_9GAMM|nr:type II toxin-antitoxin system HipA family toxin [Gilvimarinus sp. SDUM040013]MDO3385805.1 type II toxin-antitoxin system HipA family toxin [Gilvimarinus sp. SDUM040013]MDX6850633.1 type II toxin-antitoxin system HipA family toxin [Gilvimarinus sp. SDUM040013]
MVTEVVAVTYCESGHNHDVGAVSFDTDTGLGAFEYSQSFINTGIELSPLKMPLAPRIYTFAELDFHTFKGLPGLIADSLPDDFGNAVLNAWVASQGKKTADITPLQRLQYTGRRGMGALEYHPATRLKSLNASTAVEIETLVAIAQEILDQREEFRVNLQHDGSDEREAMLALLSVGMSAGGARPKAVLAFNQDFTQVRSGQARVPEGFKHFIMKFDGVSEHNTDRETFGDPMGFGAMEYVYYLMAKNCGIQMMPCHLIDEGDRRHFITQRFDRDGNDKIHVQTLNGLAHVNYKVPGSFSYAELFQVARQLQLPAEDADQLLKRLIFNIVARNHDDHAKNFAFTLQANNWRLAPAYDMAYSYKPGSRWVNSHWMSLNGKRDHFTRDDLHSLSKISRLFAHKVIDRTLEQTCDNLRQWRKLATEQNVPQGLIEEIEANFRLDW